MLDHTSFLALFALLAGCARSPAGPRSPDAIDALFAEYDRPDVPGASVVVIHEGKVVLSRAYGLAELATRTRATPDTNFRLASLSKPFTATAIMQLVERGRLRYDDRVGDVLSDWPTALGEVRIRHLLNHTSGVRDYEDFVSPTQAQLKDADVLTLLLKTDRTYFPPGSAMRYSNSGYALLALIVERASGERFASFLHGHVFAPLGMSGTVAYESGVSQVARRALGYVADGSGFRERDQSPTSAVLGDGGIYTSVVDLVAWDRALDAHALVAPESQQLAWTPPQLPAGSATHYGFGWFVDDDHGRTRLSHHGETCGFTNAIVKYPAQRLTVVVLTNRAGGEPWTIAQRIADRFLGGGAQEWPFVTTPNAH